MTRAGIICKEKRRVDMSKKEENMNDDEEKRSRVEQLVNRIEEAIGQNGVLQLYSSDGIQAADIESAFAHFENRQQDLGLSNMYQSETKKSEGKAYLRSW